MSTWGDIKIATLQKMFATTTDTLVENSNTTPYIKSMPQVANEALQLLSTAGKYIIKSHEITQDGTDLGRVKKYDLKTLVTDFYSFRNVYLDDGEEYKETTGYKTEGKGIFVLPSTSIGTWTVYYNAYPQQIAKDTLDTVELALDPEVSVLLPLYMASQLYKDDDVSLATTWRNEFEVARELLIPDANKGTIEITSPFKGW